MSVINSAFYLRFSAVESWVLNKTRFTIYDSRFTDFMLASRYFIDLTQPEIAAQFKKNPLLIFPAGSVEHRVGSNNGQGPRPI